MFYVRLIDYLAHASYELTNIFMDQSQFSDPDFISGTHERENVQYKLLTDFDTRLFIRNMFDGQVWELVFY